MPVINQILSQPSGTGGMRGPCSDWPVQWICDVSTLNSAVTGVAVSMATETLYALTGMRFGLCEVTLRPCGTGCGNSGGFYDDFGPPWTATSWPQPALIGGLWFNLTCGSCSGGCSCSQVSEVRLPAPVYDITEVTADGSVLASSAYRLDNNRLLVRTDGERWPRCNDLSVDSGPGTWTVTARFGEPLPEGAALAMGELACQFAKAADGQDCRLPAGVQQLVRQGVTISYPDVGELFRQGRTGLYLVDAFIATWNPNGLRERSRVYRVDAPTVRKPGT